MTNPKIPKAYLSPRIGHTDLIECVQTYDQSFEQGDRIYYNWNTIKKGASAKYWKLVPKTICRKKNTEEDLDSWATGKVELIPAPDKYLLQLKEDYMAPWTKGDRIWWWDKAENMTAKADIGKWVTVRKYDEALDGKINDPAEV